MKDLKWLIENICFSVYPFMEETFKIVRKAIEEKEYKNIRFYYNMLITMIVFLGVMLYTGVCMLVVVIMYVLGYIYGFIKGVYLYLNKRA